MTIDGKQWPFALLSVLKDYLGQQWFDERSLPKCGHQFLQLWRHLDTLRKEMNGAFMCHKPYWKYNKFKIWKSTADQVRNNKCKKRSKKLYNSQTSNISK